MVKGLCVIRQVFEERKEDFLMAGVGGDGLGVAIASLELHDTLCYLSSVVGPLLCVPASLVVVE